MASVDSFNPALISNFTQLVSRSNDAPLLSHGNGDLLYFNDRRCEFLDISREQLAGGNRSLQSRRLRVIETREARPFGANKGRKTDFRLMAASNRHWQEMLEEKTFRDDLYYRRKATGSGPGSEKRRPMPADLNSMPGEKMVIYN